MLERFLAIAQYILAHVTEVDVQFAVVVGRVLGIGQSRIHKPELDILDVRFLKVRIIQTTHHTSPTFLWIGHSSVRAYLVGADVVLSALLGIERQVEYRHFRIDVAGFLAIRIDLILIDDTCTMVA